MLLVISVWAPLSAALSTLSGAAPPRYCTRRRRRRRARRRTRCSAAADPPPAAAAAVTGAQDPQQALFASLLAADPKAATAAVELTPRSASGQRSLVATRSVEAGASLLTVPKSLLVTAHRSGVIGGLAGQTDCVWDAAGDLRDEVGEELFERGATWDVRLALGVFDACAGAGGPFWDQYRRLLPPPPRVAHPLTLPTALLDELQDDALRERVLALREKLRALPVA